MSVRKGEHVEVVANGNFRWWIIKKKNSEKKGMVANTILKNCPENVKDCAVVTESYDETKYLKFIKSEQLEIIDWNFCEQGWWYARSKRTFKEGFIHPSYVSTKVGILNFLKAELSST